MILQGRAYSDEQKLAIILRVLDAWRKDPHQRLGQLIMNATRNTGSLTREPLDIFNVEDEDLAAAVERFSER